MQRMKDERGAVGVVVALLMVPLMGFAALAVDVSGMYSERQQLQTGADAGALAIAQACAAGSCGTPGVTAQTFAAANLNSGTSTATVTSLTAGSVSVRNTGVRNNIFGPVLGIDSSVIHAKSSATWGAPTGGTAGLPLVFNKCEFDAQTGGGVPSDSIERTILFSKTSATGCTKHANFVPGGFAWVEVNSGTCNRSGAISGQLSQLPSDPGNSPPSSCSPYDFAKLADTTVLLPIFDVYGGTGSNAWYRVYGYAAFRITGYFFAGQFNLGSPCSGSERCIRGYFTKMTDRAPNFSYGSGAPQLGAGVITLTE